MLWRRLSTWSIFGCVRRKRTKVTERWLWWGGRLELMLATNNDEKCCSEREATKRHMVYASTLIVVYFVLCSTDVLLCTRRSLVVVVSHVSTTIESQQYATPHKNAARNDVTLPTSNSETRCAHNVFNEFGAISLLVCTKQEQYFRSRSMRVQYITYTVITTSKRKCFSSLLWTVDRYWLYGVDFVDMRIAERTKSVSLNL